MVGIITYGVYIPRFRIKVEEIARVWGANPDDISGGLGVYSKSVPDLDEDTAREMLKEVARLAENELAESFIDADRNPPVYDPQTQAVTMPESFKKSYKAYQDSGFWSVDVNEELGGTVAPPSLKWAMNEMVLGANPAIAMFAASYAFARLLYILGTDEQKKLAPHIIERGWHCTMVLTEPDAGSDVGAGRTKAVQNEDGTWNITGTKRFITSAESDMVDNVIHFVLARPEGAGAGTKGLSLFIVPKYHVDLETGDGVTNVAYTRSGEYLRYFVDSSAAQAYELKVRAANPDATTKALKVYVDGVPAGQVNIAGTGGWANYREFTASAPLDLSAGRHVVTIAFEGVGRINLDWMSFVAGAVPTATPTQVPTTTVTTTVPTGTLTVQPTVTSSPYGPGNVIPGRVQAEDYDRGGQNVAYYDTTLANEGGAYRPSERDRKSTRLNSSHEVPSRMPSSA